MDWRPVGVEPDEGAVVLLYFPSGRDDEDRYKVGFRGNNGHWYDSEAASHALSEWSGPPSHWAPLAAPTNPAY
jgi:hypothetical protein